MAETIRIIAPTDFSPAADRAIRRAAFVASTLDGTVHLAHVLPPAEVLGKILPAAHDLEIGAVRARAEHALGQRADLIAAQLGVAPTRELFHGRAHEAILDAIDSYHANIVVIGAQGEREGVEQPITLGNTALKIAQEACVPVLLVRSEARQPYSRVVGCVRGDQSVDRRVVRWASELSPADLIHIVSAYSVPYERRLIEWGASQSTIDVYSTGERDQRTRQLSTLLSEAGLPAARARLHVERGEPLSTILQTAAQWQADLIVAGRAAGPDALTAGPIGSVARGIVYFAPTDVLIVPHGEH